MWSPNVSSDELYHHQRLGARWGIMNGPPYPLGRSQLSSTEKKEGGWISKFAEGRKAAKKKKKQQKALEKARKTRAANKKDAEERKRIVEKGSRDEVIKNQRRLSADEMNKALDRLKQEDIINQKLKELSSPTYRRMEKFNRVADQAKNLAVGTQKFVDAYNTGAGIYNAVMTFQGNDKRLPKVNYSMGGGDGGGKNNAPNPINALLNKKK